MHDARWRSRSSAVLHSISDVGGGSERSAVPLASSDLNDAQQLIDLLSLEV